MTVNYSTHISPTVAVNFVHCHPLSLFTIFQSYVKGSKSIMIIILMIIPIIMLIIIIINLTIIIIKPFDCIQLLGYSKARGALGPFRPTPNANDRLSGSQETFQID